VLSRLDAVLKRVLDIIGSIIGLVLCAPLMAVTALLIVLDSEGPAFFTQERVGKDGQVFCMHKFRTMVVNAPDLLDQFISLDDLAEPAFKLRHDPRVTRVGRVLRRFSVDELPQLLNVLRGEMSLVGPRPEQVEMVKRYSSWHRQRLAVKPGITGPMQISGRADLSIEERVMLELDYIHSRSLWTDVQILIKTIPAVLRGEGSY
jgi:lipopolysaccharide/colanic/teichoic acid biosynthesis glycosyltransferase